GFMEKDKEGHFHWFHGELDQFRYFLERKQYGSEDMVSRMFYRRGSWENQILIHRHMGYGSYLFKQYIAKLFGKEIDFLKWDDSLAAGLGFFILFHIPIIMAFLYFYERKRNAALLMLLLYIICGLGLVLYMNFSDGSVPEMRDLMAWEARGMAGPKPSPVQLEVRDRDYFFTPGFMMYGLWLGIAIACLLDWLRHKLKSANGKLHPGMAAALLLALASPLFPFTQNYESHNRSKNFVAYDYSYNLLMSCAKDAILFTNGDNDTFPLWFLQEVEGIRRDVRIINLSLLNTNWYIQQLIEYDPKIDIFPLLDEYLLNPAVRTNRKTVVSMEEFIQKISHYPNFFRQSRKVKLGKSGLVIDYPSSQEKSFIRVQDDLILNIVSANNWKRPVYFAVTVSSDNFIGLWPYLKMEGFVYRMYPHKINDDKRYIKRDIEKMRYNLDNIFRFTGIGLSDVYLEINTRQLLSNYFAAFLGYANECTHEVRRINDNINAVQKELDSLIASGRNAASAESLKDSLGRMQSRKSFLDKEIIDKLERAVSLLPLNEQGRLYAYQTFVMNNETDRALRLLENGLTVDPDRYEYNFALASVLFMKGSESGAKSARLKAAINAWERAADSAAGGDIPDSLNSVKDEMQELVEKGLEYEDRALPLLERVVNEMDPDLRQPKQGRSTLTAVEYLFQIYSKRGQNEKALALMERMSLARPNDKRIRERIEKLKKEPHGS
ncbi:MAG: hypothetical protein ABIA63_11705, partial [bacterium]